MSSFSSLEPGRTEGVGAASHSGSLITNASVANVWIVIHLAPWTAKHSRAGRKSVVARASVASIDGE